MGSEDPAGSRPERSSERDADLPRLQRGRVWPPQRWNFHSHLLSGFSFARTTAASHGCGFESGHGPDVSREGVQRDILPIVEGTTVNTRYGFVRTDHILFIAAGAFHVSKPSDMIPELQGRFPIRVELKSLSVEDFIRILTEPKSS